MGEVNVKWIESKLMLGVDSRGNPVVLSSSPDRDPQWQGLKPSDLLMLAAASCSMYDVVEILRKQRQPLESLEVSCEGKQMSEPPYKFTHMHLTYKVRGDVDEEKLRRAIELSEEKYCSVLATLRGNVELSHTYEIKKASPEYA